MERIISQDFKETEIGHIPKDWEVVRLGDIAHIRQGKTPKRTEYNDYKGFRIIKVKDFSDNRNVSFEVTGERSYVNKELGDNYLLQEGDILILSAAHSSEIVGQKIGYVNKLLTSKNYFVSELLRVRAYKDKMCSKYIFYILNKCSTKDQIKTQVKGVHLYSSNLSNILIPLPPLSEQTAIANILSTVQENIKKTEAVINSTNELKKSLMNHLFTYGPVSINGAEKIKLKETEVGLIPEEWNVVRLGDLFEIQQGITLCREPSPDKFLKPFLRTSNVFWGKIDLSNLDSMYFSEKQLQSLTLKSKDLLICEGGDIGRTAMWNEQIAECCHQNHLHRLRAKNDLETLPEFYMYWMQFGMLIRGLYSEEGNKTTIPNLSRSRLSNFLIPLPPLPIQKQIADIL
ncbi:MAG: restriction endonuclease subunit S, partial [Methanofastidiosum sp.]